MMPDQEEFEDFETGFMLSSEIEPEIMDEDFETVDGDYNDDDEED